MSPTALPQRTPVWGRVSDSTVFGLLAGLALVASIVLGVMVALVSGAIIGLEPILLVLLVAAPVFLFVAVRYYDGMVFVTFALFGVVHIEPAPVDLLFFAMLPIGLVTGHLNVSRLRESFRFHAIVWSLLLVVFASVALSDDRLLSTRYSVITMYCISIMYFVKMYVQYDRAAARIVGGYALGAFVSVGLVMLDLADVIPDEIVLEQGRARGLFKDSNVFSPFLIVAFILLVDEAWRPKLFHHVPAAARYAGAGTMLIGILLAFSRAGWGNLLLTSVIYVALNVRHLTRSQRRRAALGVLGAGAALSIFVVASGQLEFLASRASVLQSYDSERFDAQRTGIELGLSNVVGIGPGMTDEGGLFAPHSLYVRSFAETGIIGSFLLLALLATVMFPLAKRTTDDRVFGLSRSVIVAVAIGQLMNGFLIDTLHWRHLWLVLGFVWLVHGTNIEERAAHV